MIRALVRIVVFQQVLVGTLSSIVGNDPWYKTSKHYWPLDMIDKSKHDVLDVTGHSRSKVYGGTQNVVGVSKGALLMDGVLSTGVNLGNFSSTCLSEPSICKSGFTLLFWMRLNASDVSSFSSYQVVLQLSRTLQSEGTTFYAKTNNIVSFSVNDKTISRNVETTWNATYWVHVALVWNKVMDSVDMLFNGKAVQYTNLDKDLNRLGMIPAQQQLWMGSNYALLKNCKVEIDELAIWYYPLSPHELNYIRESKAVDGGYSPWSNFTSCSVSCDQGTTTRTRECSNPTPRHGGISCSVHGPDRETVDCFLRECLIDGNYTTWSAYSACSQSCGGGVRTRVRTCENPPPRYGGENCSRFGEPVETLACNTQHCPIHGGYSEWSGFSECSASCGDGVALRVRTCSNPTPQHGGLNCSRIGQPQKSKSCYMKICPVDGNYSEWSALDSCSKSCGGGVQTRHRKCDNPVPVGDGRNCSRFGPPVESRTCNTNRCPVNGEYTSWTTYSACSKSCEGGSRYRTRTCTNPPPEAEGENCSRLGLPRETKQCNTQPCPVHGGYGQWSEYGPCSRTCGGGQTRRLRSCDNPLPSYGGRNCSHLGAYQEIKFCNPQDCPAIIFLTPLTFLSETFRADLYDRNSAAFIELTERVNWNARKIYGPSSALSDVRIRFCEQGEMNVGSDGPTGVQCLLEFFFVSSRYSGVIKLQDALQIKGVLYQMPVKSFFISSAQVPTDYKLQVKAFNTSSRSLMVTWVPSTKRETENILGYRVMFTDELGNSYNTLVNGAEANRKELENLDIYQYYCVRVSPFNLRGDGLATFPTCAYTGQEVPSGSPEILSVQTPNSTTLLVKWIPPKKRLIHGELLGYQLKYHKYNSTHNMSDDNIMSLKPALTQVVLSGLLRFTEYSLQIAAINRKGLGKWSEEVLVFTLEEVPGKPPHIVSVFNTSSTAINVQWRPIPKKYIYGRLLGYRVFYKDTTSIKMMDYANVTVGSDVFEANLTGLSQFRSYIVQVAGFNRIGEGDPSKRVIVSTDQGVPSLPPQNVTVANTSSTSLLVQWGSIPDKDHNGIILGYKIFYQILGAPRSMMTKYCIPQTRAAEIQNLEKFTRYEVQMAAYTSVGNGELSDVVTARTAEDKPSQSPTLLTFFNTSSTSLRVTWLHIPPQYVHGVLRGYRVLYRSINVTEDMYTVVEVGPATLQAMLDGLLKYMEYGIRVLGFTRNGIGTVSDEVIVRTDQDVPSWPPAQVLATNKSSPTKIHVSWQPISDPYYIHGILLGYKVFYRAVSDPNEIFNEKDSVLVIGPDQHSVTMVNLTSFTVYAIQVLAFTSKGDGTKSPTLDAETCNCHQSMYTNWWNNPPYMISDWTGIFPSILEMLTTTCCGVCAQHKRTIIDFKNSSAESPAFKLTEYSVKENLQETTELSFPINGRMDQTTYYDFAFVPLVASSGTVFITIVDEPGTTAKMVVISVFEMWPMCVAVFVSAFFAGILMWMMDSYFNSKEFPKSPFRGPIEGMWWAFITMTTLGYGDRVPKAFHSKIFGVFWITCGLVIVSLFMSFITTTLTTEVMGNERMIYGSKIAAIQNSSEYRLGIRLNAVMDQKVKYNNLKDLYTAIKHRTVDGLLIDAYTVGSRQDLFGDPDLRIGKVISHTASYGVVMAGDAKRLQKCYRGFLKDERAEVFSAITNNIHPLEVSGAGAGEQASSLFDAGSSVFQNALFWTCGILGVFVLVFLIYELLTRKKRNQNPQKYDYSDQGLTSLINKSQDASSSNYNETRRLMLEFVEEFHSNCLITASQLRAKHRRELVHLHRLKEGKDSETDYKKESFRKKNLLEEVRKAFLRMAFPSSSPGTAV